MNKEERIQYILDNIEDNVAVNIALSLVEECDELQQENKQLKYNWNKLKEHIETCINETKQNDVYDRTSYEQGVITGLESSLFKMQELEDK